MAVARDAIIKFCREFLQVENFEDACVNGLQVEGAEKITRIVTGVSLSEQLLQAVLKRHAQMVMVHHGFFVSSLPSPLMLRGFNRRRLKLLLENDLNLAGFHLPLDAHSKIGNNVSIAKLLGVKKLQPFDVGFIGEISRPVDYETFQALVAEKLNTSIVAVGRSQDTVKKVAIISGGSSVTFETAAIEGADVLVCGDLREHIVRAAEEMNIAVINAGHYNTEKLGIQNLGALVAKKFQVPVEFVDIPCEI